MALASTSWKPGQSGNPNTPVIPPDAYQRFLDLLDDAHTVTWAAKQLGHHRDAFYEHRNHDPDFAKAWDQARSQGRADWYEERMRGRASGKEKGDTLADIVMLKVTGRVVDQPRNAAVQVSLQLIDNRPLQAYTPDQLRQMITVIETDQPALPAPITDADSLDVEAIASFAELTDTETGEPDTNPG